MINITRDWEEYERKKPDLMKNLGNNGIKMFKVNNFNAQGFIDENLDKWRPKKAKDGRRTLVGKTGVLRNTIFYNATRKKIVFGTLAKYGAFHNKGTRKLPQRQFMGNSEALNKINNKEILRFIKKRLE